MAHANYRVIRRDTTAAATQQPLIPVGEKFDGFRIVSVPAGLAFAINWSGQNDLDHFVDMVAGDVVLLKDHCNNPFLADEGLFITHGAAAGLLIIVISQGTTPDVQEQT